jgi:hypothetical protein
MTSLLKPIGNAPAVPIPGTETPQGITNPVFSPDGRSIAFWSAGDQTLKRIPVTGGTPVALPITGFVQASGRRQFDITSDGKQFLMLFPAPGEIQVVPNWFDDLKRRVAPP